MAADGSADVGLRRPLLRVVFAIHQDLKKRAEATNPKNLKAEVPILKPTILH